MGFAVARSGGSSGVHHERLPEFYPEAYRSTLVRPMPLLNLLNLLTSTGRRRILAALATLAERARRRANRGVRRIGRRTLKNEPRSESSMGAHPV